MTDSTSLPQILDKLITGIVIFDDDLKIIYANQSIEEIFHQSTKKLVGLSIQELFHHAELNFEQLKKLHDFDSTYYLHNILLQISEKQSLSSDLSFSCINIADSRYILLEVHLTNIKSKLNDDFIRKDQHEATSDLLRRLAHEIKNPLGGLRGAAQLLGQELTNPELGEYTDIIIRESDRLRNLVDRMLGPHKVEDKIWINIHKVIENARKVTQVNLPKEISIRRDYDPSLPDVFIAPEQIQQALLNLLKNAIEAVGNSGEITIKTRILNQFTKPSFTDRLAVKIDIIDDGPGIDPELKARIFFPLVSGHAKGTGLGLNIAQTLVQQNHGIIECDSRPQHTVFSILLPIKSEE